MLILTKLFFMVIGLLSIFASMIFGLFTVLALGMMIQGMTDKEFSLKYKAVVAVLFGLCIAWGFFLTKVSVHYGTEWLLNLR